MKSIYLDNGYLDMPSIIERGYPFTFVVGGRGTGKTFGALKYLLESGRGFIFLRRTKTQTEMISNDAFSPLRPLNDAYGWDYHLKPMVKGISGIYNGTDEKAVGACTALSTISNIRGFDGSWIDVILFDEFIPEPHERPIKDEYGALMNCYETINRNRELDGRKPVQLVALSNSNSVNSPILTEMGILLPILRTIDKGKEEYINSGRGVYVVCARASEISRSKSETALYKAQARRNNFAAMALNNDFPAYSNSHFASIPRHMLSPFCKIGELGLHWTKDGRIYVCPAFMSYAKIYDVSQQGRKRLSVALPDVKLAYLRNAIVFQDQSCELLLTNYLNM